MDHASYPDYLFVISRQFGTADGRESMQPLLKSQGRKQKDSHVKSPEAREGPPGSPRHPDAEKSVSQQR